MVAAFGDLTRQLVERRVAGQVGAPIANGRFRFLVIAKFEETSDFRRHFRAPFFAPLLVAPVAHPR